MLFFIATVVIILTYYILSTRYDYWKKRKVPFPKPSILFGNIGDILILKRSIGKVFADIYKQFPDVSYVGYYKIGKPGLVLRDPRLIRDVLNKDFGSFHDNDISIDKEADPIGGRSLLALKGHSWKIVKNQITPCFTTTKLKAMYGLVENGAKKLVNHLEENSDSESPDGLEVREMIGKYFTEVLASCAFGVEGRSFDSPNPVFKEMANKIFEPSLPTMIKFLTLLLIPSLAGVLKIALVPKSIRNHLCGIVKATIKNREENNIVRNDFLDFMIDLRNKGSQYEFTDMDLTAHASAFVNGGYETSSATMTYIIYELVAHPEVYEKARMEIDYALLQNNGRLDYDALKELKYLDAIVHESMRLHPAATAMLRVCTKPFTFPSPRGSETEEDVTVEVDTPIIIPVYALHHDAQYFKDPEAFNPDRFLPENKESIIKGTYLPFGDGPRTCIGLRFALIQMKIALINIIANFDIKFNKKTLVPWEDDQKYLIPHCKGGVWLNFSKRK